MQSSKIFLFTLYISVHLKWSDRSFSRICIYLIQVTHLHAASDNGDWEGSHCKQHISGPRWSSSPQAGSHSYCSWSKDIRICFRFAIVYTSLWYHNFIFFLSNLDGGIFGVLFLAENDTAHEKNTIVFKLDVRCKKGGGRIKGSFSKAKSLPLIWRNEVLVCV